MEKWNHPPVGNAHIVAHKFSANLSISRLPPPVPKRVGPRRRSISGDRAATIRDGGWRAEASFSEWNSRQWDKEDASGFPVRSK
jgi:hypothetical protein